MPTFAVMSEKDCDNLVQCCGSSFVCQCCSAVFLSFYSEAGLWDEAGCRVEFSDETHTRCVCSHLSTFAVLMDVHDYVVSGFEWKVTNPYYFVVS